MFAPLIVTVAALALAPQPTVQQALQIAYRADPQAACAGFVAIQWDKAVGLRGNDEEVRAWDVPGPIRPVGCFVTLDPALNKTLARRCDVIVHGVKHLAGHRHTARGIMSLTAGKWPACHRWDHKHRVKTKRHGNRFDSR
jgi:hypothetical protein